MASVDLRIGFTGLKTVLQRDRSKSVAITVNKKIGISVNSSNKDDAGSLAYICIKINNTKICLAL